MALHVLAGLAGWAGFGALWAWQLSVFVPANWLGGLELIGALVGAFALFAPLWVWWNRSIYRRRHRRRTPIRREVQFTRDGLGRGIEVSPGVHLNPVEVLVSIVEDGPVKRYDVPAPLALEPEEPEARTA